MLSFRIGSGRINCLAFSPMGDCLAVGSGDRTVYLVNWPGGDVGWRLPAPGNRCVARCLAFREDGQTLCAIFTDGRTLEWERTTGKVLAHHGSSWHQEQPQPIAVWHAGDQLGWEWVFFRPPYTSIAAIGSSFERELFLRSNRRMTWAWPIEEQQILTLGGKQLQIFRRQLEKIEPSPTLFRQVLATLFRPLLGPQAPVMPAHSQLNLKGRTPSAAAIWPDHQSLMVGDARGMARRISRHNGQTLREWGLAAERINALAVASDSTVAAAGFRQGTIIVWDLDD